MKKTGSGTDLVTVSDLAKGLQIIAKTYPTLWVKPVISIKDGYLTLECAGIKDISKMPDADRESLKSLGWAVERIRGSYYWYLAIPDDQRIKTWHQHSNN